MKEIQVPNCPICGGKREIYERNNAFLFCKGAEDKEHKADFLETTKNYFNGNGNGKHPEIEAPRHEVVK